MADSLLLRTENIVLCAKHSARELNKSPGAKTSKL